MYEITNSIPTPENHYPKRKYPLNEMKVGDSFLSSIKEANNARTAAYLYGKRSQKKFSSKTVKEENGVRIWRVE